MATKFEAKETEEIKKPVASVKPVESADDEVEIELFYDGKAYSGDVFVAVNGESILIQRGKPVKVKRKFAEVIKRSEEQKRKVAALKDKLRKK